MRILLVEDESDIASNLRKYLYSHGFEVDLADSLRIAWESVRSIDYPLVILDRRLPDGDGVELISMAHRLDSTPRFLVLSALADVEDKVAGLNLGASDYMAKPFEPKELLARMQAMLRLPRPKDQGMERIGDLSYDRGARQFAVAGRPLDLRRRELDVLEVLVTKPRQLVSRNEIVDRVYGLDETPLENTLDSHLSRLRHKLRGAGAGVKIHTARNLGYLLQEAEE